MNVYINFFCIPVEQDAGAKTVTVVRSEGAEKVEIAEVETAEVEIAEVETAEVETAEVEIAEVETAEVERAEVVTVELETAPEKVGTQALLADAVDCKLWAVIRGGDTFMKC